MRRHLLLLLRLVRFTLVGACCFAVQAGILLALRETGVPLTLANAVGFALSAQLNFVLSTYFTWGDRRIPITGARTTAARWASFQATAGIALACNTGVFALAVRLVDPVAASAVGVVSGALLTFLVNHHLIFRKRDTAARTAPGGRLDTHRPEPALPRAIGGAAAD